MGTDEAVEAMGAPNDKAVGGALEENENDGTNCVVDCKLLVVG